MGTYNLKAVSDLKNTSFEALPADRYVLEVLDATVEPTSTGTEMIKVTFVVTQGLYKNRKLWHNFPLSEKSLPFLTKFLKECGSNIVEEEDVSSSVIAQAIIGKKVTAYTEPGRTPNNKPKNDLKNWTSVAGYVTPDNDDEDNLFS